MRGCRAATPALGVAVAVGDSWDACSTEQTRGLSRFGLADLTGIVLSCETEGGEYCRSAASSPAALGAASADERRVRVAHAMGPAIESGERR
jgi:hypothetical protein